MVRACWTSRVRFDTDFLRLIARHIGAGVGGAPIGQARRCSKRAVSGQRGQSNRVTIAQTLQIRVLGIVGSLRCFSGASEQRGAGESWHAIRESTRSYQGAIVVLASRCETWVLFRSIGFRV